MRKSKSLDQDYFDGLYQQDKDPWDFTNSAYEHAKYEHTLSVLGDEPARHALEVGCSIGVLTKKLAAHCDRLLATDVSRAALDQAEKRCEQLSNVDFRLVSSAGESFDDQFDLIVLSEVVYYWDDADIAVVADKVNAAITIGGRLLLVHWLGETDYPKTADDAVGSLAARLAGLYTIDRAERTKDYRLDLWRWSGAP